MSQFFGFELLFNSVNGELKEKHELLVVVFHWFLIRENFLCLGVGTERDIQPTDNPSELMPPDWNENQETYYLRYFNAEQKEILVLDVTMSSDQEAVITIAGDDAVTQGFTLSVQDYLGDFELATNTKTKIQQIMPKIDELMYKFQTLFKQLVPVQPVASTEKTAETPVNPLREPLAMGPRHIISREYPELIRDPMDPFRGIGRGDLDPFHVGGGMLAGGQRNLPHVRYDPTGPVPINDHFAPPGGSGFLTDPDALINPNLNPNRRGPKRPGPDDMFGPPGGLGGSGGGGGFDWYG